MSRHDEVARLLREIQTLALELAQYERREGGDGEFDAKRRTLEQLRWRLASASRRVAHGDLGNAA
jgi:hypothetical protein